MSSTTGRPSLKVLPMRFGGSRRSSRRTLARRWPCMALLDVEDLHVRYGAIVALRGMSLTVNEGEIVGLIGVNGAGKSTTMKAIMQIVRPELGAITYEGHSLIGMAPENVVRRGIA